MSRTWTVKALSVELQRQFDRFWPKVTVEGEIAQLQTPASGHCYFTLKEGDATLGGVVWRTTWSQSRFKPKAGQRVLCHGKLGLFNGRVQLYANVLEPAGDGFLARQLQERLERLRAEGLLDPGRKRALPPIPRTVGVATSSDGAAIADFLRVSRRRFPAARILVAPCKVQGPEAPSSVLRALELLVEQGESEVIVITRGGGSKDDLLGFWDETLARAVATCPIPVVSAVGHEIDTSLIDLVADAVAATPSMAANIVFPDARELARQADGLQGQLHRAWSRDVEQRRQRIDHLASRLRHPQARLKQGRKDLGALEVRRERAISALLGRRQHQVQSLDARLAALSPLAVLERGYAMARTSTGEVLIDASAAKPDDVLLLQLARGSLRVQVLASE